MHHREFFSTQVEITYRLYILYNFYYGAYDSKCDLMKYPGHSFFNWSWNFLFALFFNSIFERKLHFLVSNSILAFSFLMDFHNNLPETEV